MLNYIDKKYFKLAISGPYRETDLDIAVKCPICGDSRHKRNSKRLHLFYKDSKTRIKCFNGGCPVESPMSTGRFLRTYYPQFYEAYKKETYKQKIELGLIESKPKTGDTVTVKSFTSVAPQPPQSPQPPQEYPNGINPVIQKIKYVTEQLNPQGIAFLESRGLRHTQLSNIFGDFYSGIGEFMHEGKYYNLSNTLFIPIFTAKNPQFTDMVGFYARSTQEKRFVNNALKGHFMPWNLNKIDNTKDVYIFEAILDAMSFYQLYGESNIIALCTNNINPKILDYIQKPVFCLDNDTTGIQTMLKYTSNKNAKFLIYPEDLKFKDFNEMLLSNFKFNLEFESAFKANIMLRKSI